MGQSILAKKIANRFQNVRFSGEIIERELGLNPFETTSEQTFRELVHTFEKRHPITHNLGVIDRKYLERMRSAEHEGREVMVTPDKITQAITTVLESVSHLHGKLFGNLVSKVKGIPDQPVVPGRDVTVPSV